MLQDPHDTIHYDQQEADRIDNRFELIGSDGKLLWDSDGRIIHTTLAENCCFRSWRNSAIMYTKVASG